jgi:hypothetical protein
MGNKEVSMKRRVTWMAFVLVSLVLSPPSAFAQAPGVGKRFVLVDSNAKADPGLVYVIMDFQKDPQVYAMKPDRGDSVLTVLKQLGPMPRHGNQNYDIWLQRPGQNEGADQAFPVAWDELGTFGVPAMDLPVQPGDRIYLGPRLPVIVCEGIFARIPSPMAGIRGMIENLGAAIWSKLEGFVESR